MLYECAPGSADTLPTGAGGREAAVPLNSAWSEGEGASSSLAGYLRAAGLRFSKGLTGCEAFRWDLETLSSSVNLLLNICVLTISA